MRGFCRRIFEPPDYAALHPGYGWENQDLGHDRPAIRGADGEIQSLAKPESLRLRRSAIRRGSEVRVRRVFRIEEALEDADVVLALRVQNERLHEPALSLNDYILLYQLSAERMRHAKADAIVLHPGPLNRGIEITPEVADSAQSCVLEQVTNGIAVRMALLFVLTGWRFRG